MKTQYSPTLLFFLAVIAAALLSGCGKSEEVAVEETVRTLAVRTQSVAQRSFERRLTVQGTLEAKHFATVAARSDGNLDAIWVDEGDKVVEGKTALFQVDSANRENAVTISQQDLAVAKASLAVAKASAQKTTAEARKATLDFSRYERLHQSGKVSVSEFESAEVAHAQAQAGLAVAEAQVDLAERQVKQADAALAIAKKNVSDAKSFAPLSGVVSIRHVEPGEQMSVGKAVLRIDNLDVVEAAAFLPAQYYSEVVTGTTTFRLGVSGREAGAHAVTYRSPTINPSLRTFEIKGQVTADEGLIVPGQMADLTIVFSSRQGLGVPSVSILIRDDKPAVFVAQDGHAIQREVEPGLQNDGWTEILSGLSAGESVIAEGQTQLRDGMWIEVL